MTAATQTPASRANAKKSTVAGTAAARSGPDATSHLPGPWVRFFKSKPKYCRRPIGCDSGPRPVSAISHHAPRVPRIPDPPAQDAAWPC